MAMDLKEIEGLIKETFSDATVEIQDLAGDGNHYSATVTSSKFSGKVKLNNTKWYITLLKEKWEMSCMPWPSKQRSNNGRPNKIFNTKLYR